MDLPAASELIDRARDLLRMWGVADESILVAWNPRLRTSAGRAFPSRGLVELNPRLLRRDPRRIDAVLTHEAAHVAARRLFGNGISPHGAEWRSLMARAGVPPIVRHAMPTDGLRRRRFFYLRICEGCGRRGIARSVRRARCRCGASGFRVFRAPATKPGLAALRGFAAEGRA
ncbi:MAG: hypothetical protein Fur0037_24510 [Planctomycetota bacterium]